ncbi:sensor histidine kinase KdpD [Deltaproteobacteria bacterium PRO3]|nr:sensor histidine kinase KdpD [Deltaproteobacteria bacterium PRO3]
MGATDFMPSPSSENRPNPDELLAAIKKEEAERRRGKLRLFFGMAAGVGKTFAMLKAAQAQKMAGVDVAVGIVETHGRQETAALLEGLPLLPRKQIEYRGTVLEEMDLEAVLARKPRIVLVDELAHTNAPGSRHPKRYQDVLEILEAGIDVYSTMNVQHLESRVDLVQLITAVPVRETVPDSVLDLADQIELIDISPHELLKRFREGKVYPAERANRAMEHFFQESHLTALREISLRATAERVDQDLQEIIAEGRVQGPWGTGERIMVAVTHSPFSERLIRAARKMAVQMETTWIALYVDTGRALGEPEQNLLVKNLELARELGAEVVTTQDTDVAAAIQRVAAAKNVAQVVIGRPTRRFWRELFQGGSLIDRLARETRGIDVHVIRQPDPGKKPFRFLSPLKAEAPISAYWKTAAFIACTAALGWVLRDLIGYQAVGFIFLLMVMAVGLVASLGPTLFAATLASLIWNFFFIPPLFTFYIRRPEDIMMFLTFFVVAVVTGSFAFRLRRQQRALRQREEKTNILYEILKAMTLARGVDAVVKAALERMEEIFGGECCVLTRANLEHDDGPSFGAMALDEKERAVARWSFEHGRIAGWSTETLPMASSLAVSLKWGERKYGVLLFRPRSRRELTPEQENFLFVIANQIAVAVAKNEFEEEHNRGALLAESERLHQTLLNCISHELRTPLTGIMGAATALQEEKTAGDPAARGALVKEMIRSVDRLNRVFENLLDMTRLESGMLKINKEWFDIRDLARQTLKSLQLPLAEHRVVFREPEQGLYLQGDFQLLEHAVSNILLNAASYSPPGTVITVELRARLGFAVLSVADQGPGIPKEMREHIFEKFYRVPGTPAGGTGLGLAIAKSLVETHGGRIEAGETPQGGAEFSVWLPLPEAPAEIREATQ